VKRKCRIPAYYSHDAASELPATSAVAPVRALWTIVDLRLVFQARDMLFLWNVRYFTDFLGQPGALLEWTDKLLVQWCYHGWPAAIAIAVTAWLLLVSMIGLTNALSRASIGGTWVIPGILLVSLYGSYLFPTSVVMGLMLAMTAANAWCRLPARRPWLRLVFFVAISAVLYYVTGEAYYCFAACCVIHEALAERRRLSGGLFVLAAAAVKFGLDALLARLNLASHHFYVFTLARQQRAPLNWRESVLYLYFPACALFVVFWPSVTALTKATWRRLPKLSGKPYSSKLGKNSRKNQEESGRSDRGFASARISPWVRWAGGSLIVLSLAGAAGFYSWDRQRKALLEIDFCAEHGLWDDVLAKARTLPFAAYSEYVNHDVNRALYHTGHLTDQMFSYPQRFRCPALLMPEQVSPKEIRLLYKPFGLLLELGRISEAERVAIELLETWPTGATLRRLALTKMIKDQPSNARVLLNVLRDDLVWGQWAEGYLQRLAADPSLAGDEEVRRMRGLMLVEDDLHLTSSFGSETVDFYPGVMLLDLLKRNGANRMAFEYFMATCLCNDDVQPAVQAFAFLDGLPYSATPPLYEEALLIYLMDHPQEAAMSGSAVLFRGRLVSARTMEKFRRLKEISAL